MNKFKLKIKDILDPEKEIANLLTDQELHSIVDKAVTGEKVDQYSMDPWLRKTMAAKDLVRQSEESKNTPWEKASNINFPLATRTVMDMHARLLSEVCRGDDFVTFKVLGVDPDNSKMLRAQRLAKFHNYQLNYQLPEWQQQLDKLLRRIVMYGIAFKKTYWDDIKERPVNELVSYEHMIINDNVPCLNEARRITQKIYKYKSDIISGIRADVYKDLDVDLLRNGIIEESVGGSNTPEYSIQDDDAPILLYEQHCWIDLDGDGYEEPYVVLYHKGSMKVLRIIPRYTLNNIKFVSGSNTEIQCIEPIQYYTDFMCFVSDTNNYWPEGYSQILYPISNAVNTIMNQLVDSGTLNNLQSGFLGKQIRIRGGNLKFKPGEWKPVDVIGGGRVSDYLYPLPTKDPSQVLYQLMNTLIEANKDLASLTDTLLGKGQTQNVPANTILTLEKQGLNVYNSVQKRLYKSFREDFSKLFEINRQHLTKEVYENILDEKVEIGTNGAGFEVIMDFEDQKLDVYPVFDPEMTTERARLAKIEVARSLQSVKQEELDKRVLEILDIDSPEKLVYGKDEQRPVSPEALKMQAEANKLAADADLSKAQINNIGITTQQNELKARVSVTDAETRKAESEARIEKMISDRIVNEVKLALQQQAIAQDATTANSKQAMEHMKMQLDSILETVKMRADQQKHVDANNTKLAVEQMKLAQAKEEVTSD